MPRSSAEYSASMHSFVRLTVPGGGVNSYTLRGAAESEATRFHTFFAFFPTALLVGEWIAIGEGPHRLKQIEVYKKVRELSIPEKIQRLPIVDIPARQRVIEIMHASQGLPIAGLAFGRTFRNSSERIVLFAVNAIRPATVLEMMKEEAQRRMASYN